MSRIGKNPLEVPKDVKVSITSTKVNLDGPKGKLTFELPLGIKVEYKDNNLIVTRFSDSKQNKANHGTVRSLLRNMTIGVTKGHSKNLEIQGIGFRAQATGQKIVMNLGFSHPVEFVVPDSIKVATPKPVEIKLESADKMLLGQIAAKIRDIKPPEPYKGKGIRYSGEVVRRKQGKSTTK